MCHSEIKRDGAQRRERGRVRQTILQIGKRSRVAAPWARWFHDYEFSARSA